MKKTYALILLCLAPMWAFAQVGEHRNQFAVGFQAGYNLNKVDFVPKVNQKMHKGLTGGLMARYTCEKYFKTICSIQMEFNYSQLGWEEDIRDDANDKPVHPLQTIQRKMKGSSIQSTIFRFHYSHIWHGEKKSKA